MLMQNKVQNKWDHMLKAAPPRPREAFYLWWERSWLDPKLSNSKDSQHFFLSKILVAPGLNYI